jgi:hypothetical protein
VPALQTVKAYPLHPCSSKLAASKRRSKTGTNPVDKQKSSANLNCEIDPPNRRERLRPPQRIVLLKKCR